MFFLGMIVGILMGLLLAGLTATMIVILRNPIEKTIRIINQSVPKVREKGSIIEPESDNEIAQNEIIEENRKSGRDTRLGDIIIEE